MDKWLLFVRDSVGGLGYEVWRLGIDGNKFYIKVWVYQDLVKLSGDKAILLNKVQEIHKLLDMVLDVAYEYQAKGYDRWTTIRRGEVGRFFYQLLEKNKGFWVKVFVYDTQIQVSGKDKETFIKKVQELQKVFEFLLDLFRSLNGLDDDGLDVDF